MNQSKTKELARISGYADGNISKNAFKNIKKSYKNLRWDLRRAFLDQTAKLNLSQIAASARQSQV